MSPLQLVEAVKRLEGRVNDIWRAVFPPDGSVLAGHTTDGRPVYVMGSKPVELSNADPVEMLREMCDGNDWEASWRSKFLAIIAAIEAERKDWRALRAREKLEHRDALAAEQRAHGETKAMLQGAGNAAVSLSRACGKNGFGTWADIANDAEATIATLRAKLAETEREREHLAQRDALQARIDKAISLLQSWTDNDSGNVYPPSVSAAISALTSEVPNAQGE
jgi:hypothetical protein